jgi:hypothetical protein
LPLCPSYIPASPYSAAAVGKEFPKLKVQYLWRSNKPIMSSKYINISLYYGFKGGVRIEWSPPKKEKIPLGRKLSPLNFRI